ncbi:hypothetical protein LINGRAHAP2_LOCUS17614 [Linum grandiflorum]
MERSEPSLAPEWLRTAASVSGGGSSSLHHFASSSSSSHSDVASRSRKSISDFDSSRLDRTSSSNSRRTASSNGSGKHAYSSFSRNHRDKERDREKDRLSYVDHWDRDRSDSLGSLLTGKDGLRRSHSLVSRKQSEVLPRRDLRNGSSSNLVNGNGVKGGQKGTFEKEFPSLGTEERPDVVRVSSPGLSNAVQIVSAGINGEGWTSALAEAPPVVATCAPTTVQVVAPSASAPPSSMAGLNMAETLTQAPARARSTPQLAVETQRLEELAIKQSRQLIPVIPSLPKSLVNASDKLKPKLATRSGEMSMAAKNLQQQQQPSFHPTNQSLLGGKPEAQKSSLGKLFILKPGRENGVSHSPKDVASPTHSNSRVVNTQAAPTSVVSASPRSPINPKIFAGEKKPSLSQTQSRNDFFNLLKKKKATGNASAAATDSTTGAVAAAGGEKLRKESVSDPESPQDGNQLTSNGGGIHPQEEVQRFSEEEAAFLRSLGWEEPAGEEEGLTEEEINAFYKEYMKMKPSTKVNGELQVESDVASTATSSGL